MTTPAFSTALDQPLNPPPAQSGSNIPVAQGSIPVAQGYAVVAPPAPQYSVSEPQEPTVDDGIADNSTGHLFVGFDLFIPPKPNVYNDGLPVYEILGTDAQIVQFPLRAGRQVMCFSGAMCYMSEGMKMDVKLAGLGKTFGRLAGGGSLFQLTYTNETQQDGYISMTPDYPGVIVPINMHSCPSGKIIAMRDSFLCATVGLGEVTTDVGGGFNPAQSVAGVCCGGVDLIVQTVRNGEWAFLMAMGTVIQKTLSPGEKILVDTDSILCFESSVTIDVQFIGSGIACCCAGEGLFNTTMTGPGKIWLQSLSIDKMRRLFPPKVQQSGGGDGDDGGD